MTRSKFSSWLGLTVILLFAGCDSTWTLDFSNVGQTSSPIIAPAQLYDTWTSVTTGVDFKQLLVTVNNHEELLDVVRIDPAIADIQLHIQETDPATVSTWQSQLGASVVINASYFDEAYQLVTRTKTDTAEAGPLLSGRTGYFYQVNEQWKISDTMDTTAHQLLQSYPLLVSAGEATLNDSDTDTAQRTVVATGPNSELYLIVAEYGVLSLEQLSQALADLDHPTIEMALNLDGGSSTGLAIESNSVSYLDDSFLVPSVVAIQ